MAQLSMPPRPYSPFRWAGSQLYIAGLVAIDRERNVVVGSTVAEQTAYIVDLLEGILGRNGLGLADLVANRVFLTSIADIDQVDAVYRDRFPEPYPVRTTIGIGVLARPELLVEIDGIACRAEP